VVTSDEADLAVRGFQLAEVEAAAQHVRFVLLGKQGWFRAAATAQALGLERDTVRGHAKVLVDLGLLRQREVGPATRPAFEWSATTRGAALRRRLAGLLDTVDGAEALPAGVIVAVPGREYLLDELLQQASAIKAEARWIVREEARHS
jgi:predicted ArsR family transcriptional regulator